MKQSFDPRISKCDVRISLGKSKKGRFSALRETQLVKEAMNLHFHDYIPYHFSDSNTL